MTKLWNELVAESLMSNCATAALPEEVPGIATRRRSRATTRRSRSGRRKTLRHHLGPGGASNSNYLIQATNDPSTPTALQIMITQPADASGFPPYSEANLSSPKILYRIVEMP